MNGGDNSERGDRGDKSGSGAGAVQKRRRDKDGLRTGLSGSAWERDWVVGSQILTIGHDCLGNLREGTSGSVNEWTKITEGMEGTSAMTGRDHYEDHGQRDGYWYSVTFGFQRNPDVAGNGGLGGRKRVRLIAIDYRTVAGTAGAECKGDRRSKGPDGWSLERTPMALRGHKGEET